MSFLTTDPVSATMLAAVAGYLMIAAGLGKKRLVLRVERCRACGRTKTHCTCRRH
ncbi:MAG TPA: hypothetical protein VFB25_02985 [Gaiellaceae bacterium]|nr:hypothetical protein [Gaiellaceae bacterium]